MISWLFISTAVFVAVIAGAALGPVVARQELAESIWPLAIMGAVFFLVLALCTFRVTVD